MTIGTASAPGPARPRTWRTTVMALVVLAGALSIAWSALPSSEAHAANVAVDQCNDVGPGPGGATTEMTCTVTVVNTISGTTTGSTITVTRQCSLDPCSPGNGTFTSSSTDLVTAVNQCNGSGNDAAHPTTCNVTITNNISADTLGAEPVTAATVNQCVGSGAGGGGTVNCLPFPATTTDATVTQCNGSANGAGATVDCVVDPDSMVSPALPITVNQCNGTGNPGGSLVTCSTSITTNIAAAPGPTPTASSSPTPTTTPTPTPTLTSTPTRTSNGGPPRAPRVPTGGIDTGGGSTAGLRDVGPVKLGGGLLLAAAVSAMLGWGVARRG